MQSTIIQKKNQALTLGGGVLAWLSVWGKV